MLLYLDPSRRGRKPRSTPLSPKTYLRDRWHFGRAPSYRLISDTAVAMSLSSIGDITNEARADGAHRLRWIDCYR
jgi:hypothetical protein